MVTVSKNAHRVALRDSTNSVKELYAGRLVPLGGGGGGGAGSLKTTYAGLLQTCSGLEGGIEASIYAMSKSDNHNQT